MKGERLQNSNKNSLKTNMRATPTGQDHKSKFTTLTKASLSFRASN